MIANVFVSFGKPPISSGGLTSSPSQEYFLGICPPWLNATLLTLNPFAVFVAIKKEFSIYHFKIKIMPLNHMRLIHIFNPHDYFIGIQKAPSNLKKQQNSF